MLRLLLGAILLDLTLCIIGVAVGGYELLAAQQDIHGAGTGGIAAQAQSLRDRAGIAGIAFGVARLLWWPWRPLAGLVAMTAPPLRAAGAIGPLLDLGADGSAAATHALDGALPLLTALGHGHSGGSGAGVRLLAGLQTAQGSLRAARDDLVRTERDWAALDIAALPGPLRTRLLALAHLLPAADEGLRAAQAAPALLGATRPRAYLLVPQNPWDLRATGGFAGTVALLTIDRGRLTLTSEASTAVDSTRSAFIPPPLPLLAYEHFGNWLYRDANWSPDFPTSAALLRYFYVLGRTSAPGGPRQAGSAPAGVIAFDSSLLGPLLELTGPITVHVGGISVTLDAAHAVEKLDYYVNYVGRNGQRGVVNQEITGAAYSLVFRRLQELPPAKLPEVARVLGTALRERHLLLWLPDPTLGPILARHGWDGAINATRADYLYVVDTNVHYNKINQRIRESIAYRAVVQEDRSLRSTLTVTYTNTATLNNIPKPQNNTLYEDFVRVYVPLGSTLLATSGLTQPWAPGRAYNKTVFAGYVQLPSGAHATVTFTYRVPPNALADPTAYHLTVQKQPGTAALPLRVSLGTAAPDVQVNGGIQWAWQGALDADVTLATSLYGGRPRPLPLAYDAAPVVVAPGARLEPWTVLPANLPPL